MLWIKVYTLFKFTSYFPNVLLLFKESTEDPTLHLVLYLCGLLSTLNVLDHHYLGALTTLTASDWSHEHVTRTHKDQVLLSARCVKTMRSRRVTDNFMSCLLWNTRLYFNALNSAQWCPTIHNVLVPDMVPG